MTSLTELQRMAEKACNRLPGEQWFNRHELRSILMAHEQDARFIEAMSPDTAKKLIAVALAAEAIMASSMGDPNKTRSNAGRWTTINARTECVESLRAALDAIRNDTEKKE